MKTCLSCGKPMHSWPRREPHCCCMRCWLVLRRRMHAMGNINPTRAEMAALLLDEYFEQDHAAAA